ncbi:hypothetical protein RI543_001736 [Arxiozyma heterogenica]|uniref:Protein SQS1 n=1 Tax=Arxiozyma heterogenica TaxID=278026 RepID=A0AAN7ZSQ7_9SACH|nr:hypothetical protein RI543_001736 [Kazachstania heterogenica]
MVKRHKHYSKKNKSKTKNTSRYGKSSHKSKSHNHKQYTARFSLNDNNQNTHDIDEDDNFIWNRSSLPIGGNDFMIDIHEDMKDINYGKNYVSPKTVEDYYFGRDNLKNNHSLKYTALRLLGRNEDVNFHNYDNNANEDANKSNYRKRKMVFVKAKEPYDPSHELIERLRSKENERLLDNDSSMIRPINVINNNKKENTHDNNGDNITVNILDTSLDRDINVSIEKHNNETDVLNSNNASDSSLTTYSSEIISVKDLFFVDEIGSPVDTETSVKTVFSENDRHDIKKLNNRDQFTNHKRKLEFNPSLVIGKVELTVVESNNCSAYDNSNKSVVYDNVRVEPKSKSISFIEKNYNEMSSVILQNEINKGQNFDDIKELTKDFFTAEGYSDNYTIDNNNRNNMAKEESSSISDKIILKNIESLKLYESQSSTESQSNNEEDPEFGFLEEDYIINTSEVRISNIRLGLHENSYYVESYKLFGDYDSRWLDQELFIDFLLNDLHLPEHRLNSYLKYIKDSLIPKEKIPEPEYSDLSFDNEEEEEGNDNNSDSDDESDRNGISDDMKEGLDDLISYTLKYNDTRNQEFETHALQTIGKGKKKRFLVNEDLQLDGETVVMLQDKLHERTLQKAKKRRTKEDFISEENKNSKDLFKKYPFGLHVQNIKDEFELFLSYSSDSMSFPPLDPHGNKTITKFANHYNMKTKKSGRGSKQHIIIQKTKKTRWGTPNYNLISQLLKQRPIFMRADVPRINRIHASDRVIRERFNITKTKFHVKEGEIVGEDAPEIGKDNIGRRLLEKFGWTSGEGLGAHGNKGISEPVLAVVKKSKTGLGHRIKESGGSNIKSDESLKSHLHHKRRRRHTNRFH